MELPAAAEISGFPVQHMDELPTKWAFPVLRQKKMHYPTYMTTCQGCSQHLIRGEVNTRVEYRGITLPV
jgi:hypothetical protein